MAWDWHFGFPCVITVVEAEAADNGGFINRDGRKKLGNCHFLLSDKAVKYGARDEVCLDLFLFHGCNSKIRVGLGVYLAQMDLAIFLGNEANEMRPIRWHDGKCWVALERVFVFFLGKHKAKFQRRLLGLRDEVDGWFVIYLKKCTQFFGSRMLGVWWGHQGSRGVLCQPKLSN